MEWNVAVHSRIPNGAVLLILFSVVVFLVDSFRRSALRTEGDRVRADDRLIPARPDCGTIRFNG